MPQEGERAVSVVLVPPGAQPGPGLHAALVASGGGIRVEHDAYGAMASAGRAARPRLADEPRYDRVSLVVAAPTDPRLALALARYLPEIDLLRWTGSELAAVSRESQPPPIPDLRLGPGDPTPPAPAPDDDPDAASVQLTREEIDMLLAPEPPEP